MAPMNIYDFSDKLNADKKSRQEFIHSYINHLIENMDVEDIVRDWSQSLFNDLYEECHQDGADSLVEMVAKKYPEFLQSEFDVDTSLVN
jgi:hypothetical protein